MAFPIAWLGRVDEAEVQRLLAQGRRRRPRASSSTATTPDDAAARGRGSRSSASTGVRVYETAGPPGRPTRRLPIERLPNYEQLVHTDWLRELLAGERPEAPPTEQVPAVPRQLRRPGGVRGGPHPGRALSRHQLARGPGRLEPPLAGGARGGALRSLGITHDTTVILYGRDTEGDANEKWPGRRAGQIAATRAALILRYAGVDDVRILDGGYDWWVQGGNPLETVVREPSPVAGVRGPRSRCARSVIVDIDEAKEILADPAGAALVSVRTWREHIGKVSGYNYIGPAGRIAGDVWGNCGTDAYHMQHYRNVDNTMRPYPEIAANWAEAGITPDKWVAFYCGTGWRASETWFYAYSRAGSGSPSTTAAGSSGARTRSTTRSRSASRPKRVPAPGW